LKYPTVFDGQEVFGIYIHEPGPLLSNFAISITCLVLVLRYSDAVGFYARSWLFFILCIGLGATGGMVVHGFPTALNPRSFFLLWAVKNSFVPLANFFAGQAVLAPPVASVYRLRIFLTLKAAIISVSLFLSYDFLPAVIDLAFTYILVLWMTTKNPAVPGRSLLRIAFSLALISGLFYLFPFTIMDGWFTNKDAVHVFVIISLIIISKVVGSVQSN